MNVAIFRDIAPCSPIYIDVSEESIVSIFRIEDQRPIKQSEAIGYTSHIKVNYSPNGNFCLRIKGERDQ
jgi:hypothetical protein